MKKREHLDLILKGHLCMHTNSMRLETIKKESISRQSQSHETALQLYDVLFKNFLIICESLKKNFFRSPWIVHA